jgi:hypothetical protein
MAGFDFSIPLRRGQRPVARQLLRHAQHLARDRRCNRPTVLRFRFKTASAGRGCGSYEAYVDGDFAEIQAFAADLPEALDQYARGYSAARRTKSRDVAWNISSALATATAALASEFAQLTRMVAELNAPVVVNSYIFARTNVPTIDTVLRRFTETLLHARNDRLDAAIVAEHAHTAVEAVLNRVARAGASDSAFDELIVAAEEARLITDQEARSLRSLKTMRRNAKHRGQGVRATTLKSVLGSVVGVIHRLVARIDDASPPLVAAPSNDR